MAHDQYQTVKEVADRLVVSKSTERNWIKDGDVRAIEIGKGGRIAETDLNAFLRQHATRERNQTSSCDVPAAGAETSKGRPTL